MSIREKPVVAFQQDVTLDLKWKIRLVTRNAFQNYDFFVTFLIRCGIVMRSWLAWRDILRLWRDDLSRAARFSPNAVIIKPYCRLKIELTFLDRPNNLFLSGIVFFCAVPFYNSFAALHLFIIFLRLFLNGQRIAVRTKMKRVLAFRVLVFRVLVFQVLVFRVLVFRVLVFQVLVFRVLGLRS